MLNCCTSVNYHCYKFVTNMLLLYNLVTKTHPAGITMIGAG